MLRKSLHIFRIGAAITAAGALIYFYSADWAKYILGLGLMMVSVSIVVYIFFMFRRYGERKKVE